MSEASSKVPICDGRRVIVCVGTGGVGNTTVSATLGVACAAAGLRTIVMTIDPARRLAQAMGLPSTGNVETQIEPAQLAEFGVELRAPLWAMMPDVKTTFDELIARMASSEEREQRILNNRIYHHFSTALAGNLEYAAVEKLYEIYTSDRYDIIILDTPPSQSVAEFLDAPNRILDFLEQESLQWLLKPYVLAGKLSLKVFDLGTSWMLKTLGELAGGATLRELADFIASFEGMYDGFRQRSRRVRELLRSEEVSFVLVTSAQATQSQATRQFREHLREGGLRIRATVVNRVHPLMGGCPQSSEIDGWLQSVPEENRQATAEAVRDEVFLAKRNAKVLDQLSALSRAPSIVALPEVPVDVRDIGVLARLHNYFLAPEPHNDLGK